jgi:hypothetical protein
VPRAGKLARRSERARDASVTFGGELLAPGRHLLRMTMPGGEREVALTVVVGARQGPRAFVIGGTAASDGSGIGAVRRLAAELEPDKLAGSVVLLGLAAGDVTPDDASEDSPRARATRWLLALLTGEAAFGVEVRSGRPGRATFSHLRAELRDERVKALARAFGAEVIVDSRGFAAENAPGASASLRRAAGGAGVPSLVFEGGEAGRVDPAFVERAVDGVINLLRHARMLRGTPDRPPWRVVVHESRWLSCPVSGWVTPLAAAGALVAEGEPLARVHDLAGGVLAELGAPGRAVLLAAPTAAHVEAGAPLCLLGRLGPRALARAAAHAAEHPRTRVGWCEWVALPELGIGHLHAKIDTGARTSALHVRAMRQVGERGGRPLLEVRLPTGRRPSSGKSRVARVEVEEWITVRDSGGHEERRPVITTTVTLGPVSRRVRVSLTDRGDMLFPMLVGRTALGEDFVVDAAARDVLE